jgi:hypothetical protein
MVLWWASATLGWAFANKNELPWPRAEPLGLHVELPELWGGGASSFDCKVGATVNNEEFEPSMGCSSNLAPSFGFSRIRLAMRSSRRLTLVDGRKYTAKKFRFTVCIPRKITARPQSQFLYSCVCEPFYSIFPRSVHLFSCSRICRPIVGCI